MTNKEVKRIVDHNKKRLIKQLGLEKWRIVFEYKSLGKTPAKCWPDIEYLSADIAFDPRNILDEEQVIGHLRHELAHCITSTYETYRNTISLLIPKKMSKALDVVLGRADEEVVCDIVRILERMEKND